MKIHELLTDESKWTQAAYARDADGFMCSHFCLDAASFCLLGAAERCYGLGEKLHGIIEKLSDAAGGNFVLWQDAPDRTFQEVRELILKLDV